MKNNVCRVSGQKLITINNFGKQPLGNGFLLEKNFEDEFFFEMKTGFCNESKMFQLLDQPEPKKMFHENYAFYSSTSNKMKDHFRKWSEEILLNKDFNKDSFIIELGSNDGIFLNNFSEKKIKHLGIEPSKNVANVAINNGNNIITEFFSSDLAENIVKKYGKADYFFSANVMCHIPNILDIAKGIEKCLSTKGILSFEDPYLGDVIKKITYDQIYDEHVFLFSAHSVENLFNKIGMELIKLEPQTTHGGSMRYTLGKKNEHKKDESVFFYLNEEKNNGINNLDRMLQFNKDVEKSKYQLNKMLTSLKSKNKKIAGYAATSKSTTILNFCDIGPEIIDFICDTTPIKINKFSPGKHIPIKDMNEFKKYKPEYTLLFAWNHAEEIFEKEKEYSTKHGNWILYAPEAKIL